MDKLKRSAILFLWITIAWNTLEGVLSILFGLQSKSLALVAYGLGSSIEIFTSVVVLMELKGLFSKKLDEQKALHFIGLAYIFIAGYIAIEAVRNLLLHHTADQSLSGIILMITTACMMGGLGLIKHTLGKKLQSATVIADAKFTLIDGVLSVIVLVGLVINFFLPIWWIDQALALLLAGIALKEGLEELRS